MPLFLSGTLSVDIAKCTSRGGKGSNSWQLVTISSDRTISSGEDGFSGTSATCSLAECQFKALKCHLKRVLRHTIYFLIRAADVTVSQE